MSDAPTAGVPQSIAPAIRRILAPNPSPMTFQGTNTYLLGNRDIAVIDPGPNDPAHLKAILDAVPENGRITHILLTHSHLDHSALVPALKAATGAPALAFGNSMAGSRKDLPGALGGGEGRDTAFAPDRLVKDEEGLNVGDQSVTALWTPGHMGNHMCFVADDVMFTGDHVMGWATSMVSPPDGDLRAFMASLERLRAIPSRLYLPAHGAPVTDPQVRVDELIAHRKGREAQIIHALRDGSETPLGLTKLIYRHVDKSLWPAACRNVLAHLVDLHDRNKVFMLGSHGPETEYMLL